MKKVNFPEQKALAKKVPLANRLNAINSSIRRKIEQKQFGRTTRPMHQESLNASFRINEYCVCCSKLIQQGSSSRKLQDNIQSGEDRQTSRSGSTHRTKTQQRLCMTHQVCVNVYPSTSDSQSSAKYKQQLSEGEKNLRQQNLRLIEANMKHEQSLAKLQEAIRKRLYSCRSLVENYDSVRAVKQLDAISQLLKTSQLGVTIVPATNMSSHQPMQSIRKSDQEDSQVMFYQRFMQTLKRIIISSQEALFLHTKQTLMQNDYLSIEQFNQDVAQLNSTIFKHDNVVEVVRTSLREMLTEITEESDVNELPSFNGDVNNRVTHHVLFHKELSEIRTLLLRVKPHTNSQEDIEKVLDMLYRVKLRNQDDRVFSRQVQQLIEELQSSHNIQTRERLTERSFGTSSSSILNTPVVRPSEDMTSWYQMVLIQAEAIEQFIEQPGYPDCYSDNQQ